MAAPFRFQAFTLQSNGTLDRIITDVTVCAAYDPASPPSPLPKRIQTKALWDTGASRSVLSEALVKDLGLVSVGKREVHHGDGKSERLTYMVNFSLPNKVGVVGIEATEFPASHAHFSALIGMDVIALGDFIVTNVDGKTCMSFRIPSCERVDFVGEANRMMRKMVGPNDLCWCGSGKKAKKCHRV